jgi:hypothetical protein
MVRVVPHLVGAANEGGQQCLDVARGQGDVGRAEGPNHVDAVAFQVRPGKDNDGLKIDHLRLAQRADLVLEACVVPADTRALLFWVAPTEAGGVSAQELTVKNVTADD